MRALLVSVDSDLQRSLSLALPTQGCNVDVARTGTEAMAFLATARRYQLIVLGDEGLSMLGMLRQSLPGTSLVWASAQATLAQAVDATKGGAVDVWDAAPNAARLGAVLSASPRTQSTPRKAELIFESETMRGVMALAQRVALADSPVLLTGETGSGKGKLARWIHAASARREVPLVIVDCAGLAVGLAENELFGHARGACTGAAREAAGRLEAAEGGSLFLDEIGELSLGAQQKLLRFLEEGEVERLGEVRPRKVNARVIAATHRDLRQLVAGSRFREDLLYRLEVVDLRVPALRERPQDILPLARMFLAEAGAPRVRFSPEAEQRLLQYAWPGNVRELRNVVERALVLRPEPTLEMLDAALLPGRVTEPTIGVPVGADLLDLEVAEKIRILEALKRFPRLDDAANALGIDASTLWRKRKRLGLA